VAKMNRMTAALHNREMVVHLISAIGPLSQAHIARLTQLRTSTVSYIIRELETRGLVQEGGLLPADRVGRKQTLIEMRPSAAWSVGLSLDTMGNKLCLMNAAGHIVCQHSFPSPTDITDFLASVPSYLDQLAGQNHLSMDKAVGITVSVPGVVDPVAGRVLKSISFHLENYPLADHLREKLGQPVFVERNTVCGAYAERYLGCARNCGNFLYFSARPQMAADSKKRRYSFGLAMIMNGDVYRGHNSAAGELHSSDFPQPAPTDRGALPAGRVLRQKAIAASLRPLARKLADLVDVLDPEMLVLSSDDWLLTDENLQIMKETIVQSLIPVPGRELEITTSPLGMDGALFGAALLSLHRGLKCSLNPPIQK
jgi:predicted NBD/HSP70 family sugar kinase